MQKFMLSCKGASTLIEKKHRQKLSLKEKLMLFIHKAMCRACTQYEKQSLLLEQLFKSKEEASVVPESKEQMEKLEERILTQLDKREK